MRKRGDHELGNKFFDYQDDEEAIFRENEVAQALPGHDCLFDDPSFPASAESLYRTPQQPPPGSLPATLAVWARISQQEILRCHSPKTFPADGPPAAVVQGALGDSWLVSALNMLTPFPQVLKRVIVSDKNRKKGIYTLKIFKEGSWRYVHVDDRIPCSPSRTPHFCYSKDPNQVWASLIEKSFSKLHGCYESLDRGSIEQGLRCLTGDPVLSIPLIMRSSDRNLAKEVVDGVAKYQEPEKRREDLWTAMKKWQKRGCPMGCCRSVEFDRVRRRQASSASREGPGGGDPRHTGLMVGRGYGVQRVREVWAEATRTRDTVRLKLVQLNCPWGLGQWRGDWSRHSGLWEMYPSIRGKLLRPMVQSEADPDTYDDDASDGGDGGDSDDDGDAKHRVDKALTAEAVEADIAREEKGLSFWMAFDDFTAEFSQVLTCVSYSAEQEPKGLHRKSYRGRWVPGDPLTGSGGGCASPSFLQNPFYPVTIQRNATTLTICLSVWDRAWQADPSKGGPAIGYYVVRLTGSKPRLTKLRPSKIVARSTAFVVGTQSAGEHTLNSGRYAVVPVTVKPLRSAEVFLLDLTADDTVEWEQTDDLFQDLDQELRLSDDEDLTTSTSMARVTSQPSVVSILSEERIESENFDGPPGNKVVEALHEQIAGLSSLVAALKEDRPQKYTMVMDEVAG